MTCPTCDLPIDDDLYLCTCCPICGTPSEEDCGHTAEHMDRHYERQMGRIARGLEPDDLY